MKNTLLTSESSMLCSIWVFASLVHKDLIGKVFTPTQLNEKNKWMDCLFWLEDKIFIIQLKLKWNTKGLKKQIKDMLDFKKRNEKKWFKNITPLVVYGGFITEEDWQKRLKLAFKKVNNTGKEKELKVKDFSYLRWDISIFEEKIYAKYKNLEEIETASVSDWDKEILILSDSWISKSVNLDTFINLNLESKK